MAASIVLELDVVPAAPIKGRAVDFAGRQLAAFTQRRCLEPDPDGGGARPGFLRSVHTTDSGTTWILTPDEENLEDEGRTDNGTALANLLDGYPEVDCLRVKGPELHVRLTHPIACLPAMLASDRFAVPTASGLFNEVGRVKGRSIVLRRNMLGDRLWPSGPEAVIFAVIPDAEQGVRGYERALVDVTSNPNLPAAALMKYGESPNLRRQAMLMAGVLLFTSSSFVGPGAAAMRRSVSHAIDRARIVERCGGTVSAIHSMFDLWDLPKTELSRDSFAPPQNMPKCLTLNYADFPPNETVVDQISCDMATNFGISIRAKALSYSDFLRCLAAPDCDLIYSLVQPPFDDPTSLLSVFGSATWLGPAATPFVNVMRAAQALQCAEDRRAKCQGAREILEVQMPIAPVLRAQSKCLVSDRAAELWLGRDGLFRPPPIEWKR